MATVDKVKIVVVGDSGVGKTSLTHLLSKREPLTRPMWTVGCTIDVKLHEYNMGTPYQKTYFIELWDVGGSANHRNTRNVFYNGVNGVILVHDLTNRKSYENLQKWLAEVLNKDSHLKTKKSTEYDPEQYVGYSQIPVLVIGTKLDLVGDSCNNVSYRTSKISEECGADEIFLDCHQVRSLAPGTGSSVKITRFFDKVISNRYYSSPNDNIKEKKKKIITITSATKYFHND